MSARTRWAALALGATMVFLGCGSDDEGDEAGSGGRAGSAGAPNQGGGAGQPGAAGASGQGGGGGKGGPNPGGGSGGGAGAGGQAGAGGAGVAPALIGAWKGDCQPMGQGQSFSLAFDIEPTTWALDYVVYGDAACGAAFVTVHIAGPYEIGGPSAAAAGAFEARFGFAAKTITPANDDAAAFLGSASACGGGSWAAGEATDMLAGGCAGLGQYPAAQCAADYDIVSVVGDELRFGARPADNNMCTPDRRPASLSAAPVRRLP
jgi:hypothetical protein